MRTKVLLWLGVLCAGSVGLADQPAARTVVDCWDAAYLDGSKAGFVHTEVTAGNKNEAGKSFHASVELNLTVRRFNDTAHLKMITQSDEKPDGDVTRVQMRQFLGKDQQLVVTGIVKGDELNIRVEGMKSYEKKIHWDHRAIGLYGQERIFQDRHVKPGDKFDYLTYEPSVTTIVLQHVAVKDYEDVNGPSGRKPAHLLRAVVTSEKISNVQLPALTLWLNAELLPVVSEMDMPGLGKLRLYRTTKTDALNSSGSTARIKDIGFGQLIPIAARIPDAFNTRTARYRITIKGDEQASTALRQDARQHIENARGDSFELVVSAKREPRPMEDPPHAKPEFLKSCYFINSDDPLVRKHAQAAVSNETDPWQKAKRIERWVHTHMKNVNFSENFAPADHVAQTLSGDCTEHALLAAAMCRAAGVPARTAVGLVYVTGSHEPAFGFHMWTEVYVRGQWMPVDATLGRGYVGAAHIKVLDHSWYDVQSMTPLLPLIRVVGKASIEVLEVDDTKVES